MVFGTFSPHGTFRIRLEGQILVQEVSGPWNLEMVKVWAASLLPYAHQLESQGPWAALTSPDALQRMRQVVASSTQNFREVACAAAAGPEVEGYSLAPRIWAPVYDGLTPFQFFADPQVAKDWLQTHIDAAAER
jgi:hypothetical protein